jgi:hypothetical protein
MVPAWNIDLSSHATGFDTFYFAQQIQQANFFNRIDNMADIGCTFSEHRNLPLASRRGYYCATN